MRLETNTDNNGNCSTEPVKNVKKATKMRESEKSKKEGNVAMAEEECDSEFGDHNDMWLEAEDLWCHSVLLDSLIRCGSSDSRLELRISEALDTVKSAVLAAVRAELDQMRLKVERLQRTMNILEAENAFLRKHVQPKVIGLMEQTFARV